AAHDEVDLLVVQAVLGLGVALDHDLPRALGGVAAHADDARAEGPANGMPHELGVAPRHCLDLVERERLPAHPFGSHGAADSTLAVRRACPSARAWRADPR